MKLFLFQDTGIPLEVKARLQINLLLQPFPKYSMFQNIKENLYIPIVWFEESATLSSDLSFMVNLLLMLPDIGVAVFYAIGGLAYLVMFIRFMVVIYRTRTKGKDKSEEEAQSNSGIFQIRL